MKNKQTKKQTKKDNTKKLRREKLEVMRDNKNLTNELYKAWVK